MYQLISGCAAKINMFFGLPDDLFIFTRECDDHIRISANKHAVSLPLDCTKDDAFIAFYSLFDRESSPVAFLCCVAQAAVDFGSDLELPGAQGITAELSRIGNSGFNGVYSAMFSTPKSSGIAVVCSQPILDVADLNKRSVLSIPAVVETDERGFCDLDFSIQILLENVSPPVVSSGN